MTKTIAKKKTVMKKVVVMTTAMTLMLSLFPMDNPQSVANAAGVEYTYQGELKNLLLDEMVDMSALELVQAEEEFAEALRLLTTMPDEFAEIDISLPKIDWIIANTELDSVKENSEQARHEYIKYLRSTMNGEVNQLDFSFWDCLGGFAEAIIYNAIPIAKVAKIKKIVDASGGMLKFGNKVLDKYIKYTDMKKPGSRTRMYTNKQAFTKALEDVNKEFPQFNAWDALFELVSIKAIIDGCSL
jgi:hypothetical protein